MIRHIFLCIMLFHTALASAGPLIGRSFLYTEAGAIRIDVREVGKYHATSLFIDCVRNCKKNIHYREYIALSLVSMSILSDNTNHVFLFWGGGVAYSASIYEINRKGVKKIFDQGIRGYPQYFLDDLGHEMLITYDQGPTEDLSKLYKQTWYWDGQKFRKGKYVRLH